MSECAKGPMNATQITCHTRLFWKPPSASQSMGVWPSLTPSQHPTYVFLLWREGNQRLPSSYDCNYKCWPSSQERHPGDWEWQILCQTFTVINPEDTHAIAIRYHKRCRATHVTNIDHNGKNPQKTKQSMIDELGAQIEFLSLVEGTLLDGKVASIAILQEVFIASDLPITWRTINALANKIKLLQAEIPGVRFHQPKRMNETELVTLKGTRDAEVQLMEERSECSEVDMRMLFSGELLYFRPVHGGSTKSKFISCLSAGSGELPSFHICSKSLYCSKTR